MAGEEAGPSTGPTQTGTSFNTTFEIAIMANKPSTSNTRHVVPNPNGGWDNKRGGATRAGSHHDTKQEAIDAARRMSQREGSELKIHNRDGKIGQSDSHGNDPKNIPG